MIPKFDQYYWSAQYAPALLTSIPLAIIADIFAKQVGVDIQTVKTIWETVQVTPALFWASLSFLLIQINIYLSKMLFQPLEEQLSTTNMLLYQNQEMGKGVKNAIHLRIKTDFSITLLNQQEEQADPLEARRWIVEAVSRIKERVRENKMVRRRNIAYGFMRNLMGGALLATGFSVIGYFLNRYLEGRTTIFIACGVAYGFLCLMNRPLIRHFGREYAKTLFQQYMASSTTQPAVT
ncbi:hypothetical protein ACFPMF_15230 [Larkinella bovis]|uniref:Uncharacterized protein n=1 Tax=Larkinella bovis TaxID=683041 RepID=A0ABW0ICP4_9BACT